MQGGFYALADVFLGVEGLFEEAFLAAGLAAAVFLADLIPASFRRLANLDL